MLCDLHLFRLSVDLIEPGTGVAQTLKPCSLMTHCFSLCQSNIQIIVASNCLQGNHILSLSLSLFILPRSLKFG